MRTTNGPQRHRNILVLAFLIGCLLPSAVLAQNAGKLRLLVDPGNSFEFVLDHQFRMQQREIELSEGPHHFTFWAPERRMVDTTLTVEADRMKDVVIRLPYSVEYTTWQREVSDYRNDRKVRRLIPSVLTLGAMAYTAVRYAKYVDAHDQLQADLDTYNEEVSPRALTDLKDKTIPAHKDEFRDAKTTFFLAAGITAAMAGATAYLYHRSSKHKVPEFHDAERVRFNGLVWLPGPNGGEWMGGLTWNLTRR